jgi:hypothetical protein
VADWSQAGAAGGGGGGYEAHESKGGHHRGRSGLRSGVAAAHDRLRLSLLSLIGAGGGQVGKRGMDAVYEPVASPAVGCG